MPTKCVAPFCNRKPRFNVPKDMERRQKWFYSLGVTEKGVCKRAKICEDHFESQDFKDLPQYGQTLKTQLKNSAIPHRVPETV